MLGGAYPGPATGQAVYRTTYRQAPDRIYRLRAVQKFFVKATL